MGEECKICTRPFTVFRWNPNNTSNKSKKTIICMTCSRARNCCQSCMLDITYGIPLDIRDTALKMAGISGALGIKSSVDSKNREVKAIMADKQEASFNDQDNGNDSQDRNELARDILSKLAERLNENNTMLKKTPKNAKGNKHDDIANIKGADISKILNKLPLGGLIIAPESDPTLTSFFLFGFNEDLPQYVISDFCNKFGKIKSLTILHRAQCGFASFTTRKSAEGFASSISDNGLNKNKTTPGLLILDNKYPLRVSWSKQRSLGNTNEEHNKLSLVITKVMKQLAEKDKATIDGNPKNSKSNTKQSGKRNQEVIKPSTVKYKASRSDFEI